MAVYSFYLFSRLLYPRSYPPFRTQEEQERVTSHTAVYRSKSPNFVLVRRQPRPLIRQEEFPIGNTAVVPRVSGPRRDPHSGCVWHSPTSKTLLSSGSRKEPLIPFHSRWCAMVERLACSSPTKANRVHSPAGSLPDFRMWEPCRTMPLVGAFSRESHVFPHPFISALLHTSLNHPHRLSRRHPKSVHSLHSHSSLSSCTTGNSIDRPSDIRVLLVRPSLLPRLLHRIHMHILNHIARHRGVLKCQIIHPNLFVSHHCPHCLLAKPSNDDAAGRRHHKQCFIPIPVPNRDQDIDDRNSAVRVSVTLVHWNSGIKLKIVFELRLRAVNGATAGITETTHLPHRRTGFDSRRGHSRIFACGNCADDAAGRRVFSRISRFPCPFIPALLHTHLTSSVKNTMLKPSRSLFYSPLLAAVLRVSNRIFFFSRHSAQISCAYRKSLLLLRKRGGTPASSVYPYSYRGFCNVTTSEFTVTKSKEPKKCPFFICKSLFGVCSTKDFKLRGTVNLNTNSAVKVWRAGRCASGLGVDGEGEGGRNIANDKNKGGLYRTLI
ncbi:hypothetical protein PR048_025468 [Dryococelus australis]|uniref:Uncharacterized protein n=1 Tax=Dryococelus australis TaxID=614101 RepID=A0ABQ9GRE9_9NEOP|nr:hypothetical protein PR048_025468 [Dryococelus australis]